MLQRAASNAYTWWWASHIRTKQSKWLDQSLQDMEEKVAETLKIIDHDGDSFAKRAEMYYRRRPELIAFVEESYKSYRSLAERYDSLSRELQSANRKIATAFPDEVHFDVDDDEDDEEFAKRSGHQTPEHTFDGQKPRIPKAPGGPGKDFRSPSMLMSRKGQQLRRTPSYARSPVSIPASGLTKTEALEEIDNLQKEILSLQTEKEFVKSGYERGKERYWEIEHKITNLQQRVCSLQDEFSIGIVLEDNEARTLMATTALKSCQEALTKLQERHRQAEEEVKFEDEKIQEAYMKFQALSGVYVPRQEVQDDHTEDKSFVTDRESRGVRSPTPSADTEPREKSELELARDKMKEEIDAKLSVPELAEKIDEMVDKVVNLELEVSSQAALVRRLRLETAVLLAHIQSLEKEKESLKKEKEDSLSDAPPDAPSDAPSDDTEKMKAKLNEFEEELNRVKNLKQHVVLQCKNLLSQFTEASININHLSEKLESLNLDEDAEMTGLFREAKAESESKDEEDIREHGNIHARDTDLKEEEEMKDGEPSVKARQVELLVLSGPSSEFDALSEKPQLSPLQDKEGNHDLFDAATEENQAFGEEGTDDQPNWKKLFINSLEDREKILLEEYMTVLRSYKEVKNKLGEVEAKNRDGLFEMAMEIRELRNTNAQKEEELEALRQKLGGTPKSTSQDDNSNDTMSNDPSSAKTASGRQPLYKLLLMHNDRFTRNMKYKEGNMNLQKIGKNAGVPTMEEKLRVEIDELLEENLEFWLRFSTSIHQIQKFQTTFQDLQDELKRLKDAHKQQEGNSKSGNLAPPPSSETRPIYKHLREIQTEIKLWFEHNTLLNEELQSRSTGLSNIQEEISRVLELGPGIGGEDDLITEYQAAKFQGEVLNMRQENKKVEDELRAGLDIVKKLQTEIEKTLRELDKDLGISATKKRQPNKVSSSSSSSSRVRIPLRSFLFGVKLKKQKPPSLFSCASSGLQKQYSDIKQSPLPPP